MSLREAMAEFENELDVKKSGKSPVRIKEKAGKIPVDVRPGDASVSRERTIKRGIPYGEASISSTVRVNLPCQPDSKSVVAAGKVAKKLVDEIQSDDKEEMTEFINHAMRQSIKMHGNTR